MRRSWGSRTKRKRVNMEEDRVSTPFVLEHMSTHNRRMLIALVAVCITFVLTITVFVIGYTIREKNWLDTISRIGVTDGLHEQSGPGADR